MKTNLVPQVTHSTEKSACIYLSDFVLEQLGWKRGDEVSLDISMAHPGMLCVEKVEKNG